MKQEFSPYFVIYMDLSIGFVTWICHLDLSKLKLIASCDGCHAWGRRRLFNPEHLVVLLAGPISHTSTQYILILSIFYISMDLSTNYLFILVGVELPLCVVVTLS